jgi:hypothetical protein
MENSKNHILFPTIKRNSKYQLFSNCLPISNNNKELFKNKFNRSRSNKLLSVNKRLSLSNPNSKMKEYFNNSNIFFNQNISFLNYIRKNPVKNSIVKGLIYKMQNEKNSLIKPFEYKKKENKKKFSDLNLELNYVYRKIIINKDNKKQVIILQGNQSIYDSIIKETILSKFHDSIKNDYIKYQIKKSISSELLK